MTRAAIKNTEYVVYRSVCLCTAVLVRFQSAVNNSVATNHFAVIE